MDPLTSSEWSIVEIILRNPLSPFFSGDRRSGQACDVCSQSTTKHPGGHKRHPHPEARSVGDADRGAERFARGKV